MAKISNGAKIGIFVGIGVAVFVAVLLGMLLTQNIDKIDTETGTEDTSQQMEKLLNGISVTQVEPRKAAISDEDILTDEAELPDIKNYPLSVTGNADVNVEIFSSPEKAGEGTDGWLNEVAEKFNAESFKVNGKTASVSIRSISSGLALDYIKSGKYVPQAITPSNEFWGKMIEASGVEIKLKKDKLAGNVPGVLLSKSKYDEIISKLNDKVRYYNMYMISY